MLIAGLRRFALIILVLSLVLQAMPAPQVAVAQEELCTQPFVPVSPALTDLGPDTYVRMGGFVTPYIGGLYPGGVNERPAGIETEALEAAAAIQPLNAQGTPASDGKVVMISVGMSNAQFEFERFAELARDLPGLNPQLVIVNGAQSSRTAEHWSDPGAFAWPEVNARLERVNVTPQQVQVAWVKQTLTRGGSLPAKAEELQGHLEGILRSLKIHYPNIKLVYFSSRTRSYLIERGLSPEPVAFETAFAVRWLIEKQQSGDATLNYDPGNGPVVAPLAIWGPYLWADGENPRSDGFVWLAEDMTGDCTHPSFQGIEKVANLMLDFFRTDSSAGLWFTNLIQANLPMVQAPGPTALPPAQTPASAPGATAMPADIQPTQPAAASQPESTPSPTPGFDVNEPPPRQGGEFPWAWAIAGGAVLVLAGIWALTGFIQRK